MACRHSGIHMCVCTWVCICLCDHCMCTWVEGNNCRRVSLLGFAHPVIGPLFQVQVQCRWLTRIWDRIWEESWMRLCFVLFWSCIIFEYDQNMYTFWYQRDCNETVDYSLLYIFVYCELNMQEWVSIYETYECDIGALDINKFSRVDGLSTGSPGFGASHE